MVLWRPTRSSRTNKKNPVIFIIIGDLNAKIESQEIHGVTGKFGLTVHNELLQGLLAKANGVSPREYTGQSKHPLSTTQEMTLHMNIIRWSVSKSDWLYYLQLKMEKLYIDSKDKTGCWLPFRSWAPFCKIQAYIEESKKNHWAIQVWPK